MIPTSGPLRLLTFRFATELAGVEEVLLQSAMCWYSIMCLKTCSVEFAKKNDSTRLSPFPDFASELLMFATSHLLDHVVVNRSEEKRSASSRGKKAKAAATADVDKDEHESLKSPNDRLLVFVCQMSSDLISLGMLDSIHPLLDLQHVLEGVYSSSAAG